MESGLQRSIKVEQKHQQHIKQEQGPGEGFEDENSDQISDLNEEIPGRKWSLQENIHFIMFMDFYKPIFKCKSKRKSTKIYKRLAEVIPNRTSRQCRSRYQKIMKTHKNFTRAKKHYLKQWGQQAYNRSFQLFSHSLTTNDHLKKLNQVHLSHKQTDEAKETQKMAQQGGVFEKREERGLEKWQNQIMYFPTNDWYNQSWCWMYTFLPSGR